MKNVVGGRNIKKIREIRRLEENRWFACVNSELRDEILEMKEEIKRQAWFRIDDVLTRKEREERYKLKEFAEKWGADKEEFKIINNILIMNNKKYRWVKKKEGQ